MCNPTQTAAQRLANALLALTETIDPGPNQDPRSQQTTKTLNRIHQSAVAYADRRHPRDPNGMLTADGIDAIAAYIERTIEMWDVIPN